jgi:uncharacterized membrane-anchored protein
MNDIRTPRPDIDSVSGLRNHPLRKRLSREMHVRKLPPLQAPGRLMQFVLHSPPESVNQELELLGRYCGISSGEISDRAYVKGKFGSISVVWERHTEFSSYMFIRQGSSQPPFCIEAFAEIPSEWLNSLPGEVLRATQVAILDREDPDVIAQSFSAEDIVGCDIADGGARLWSDFRLHDDGFGRLLVINRSLTANEIALAVQRAQELGNYRNMALLGLPVAQQLTPTVTEFERQLAELTGSISASTATDAEILHDLSVLSADLARVMADTRYRMSASRAYAEIVTDRLNSLRIGRIPGYQTLADFTDRRLLPAVRTCISFSARLEDLSQRVAWTTSLLRTRVDTSLSQQNRDLLASMDRRTYLQLRLQQTVEGLSTVAIGYYMLGLFGYLVRGIERELPLDHDIVLALLVPVALFCAWFLAKRIVHIKAS